VKQNHQKIIVLDTNVVIHDPKSIYAFDDNHVVIPLTSWGELDNFKGDDDWRGLAAREVIRQVVSKMQTGLLADGVNLDGGGKLFVSALGNIENKPIELGQSRDDHIVLLALKWKEHNPDSQVILVSNDGNVLGKGSALRIKSQPYQNDQLSPEEYVIQKKKIILVGDDERDVFRSFCSNKETPSDLVFEISQSGITKTDMMPVEYCDLVGSNGKEKPAIYRESTKSFELVDDFKLENGSISSRNNEQAALFKLLHNQKNYVSAVEGIAGSGKTLVCLAAGHSLIDDKRYKKIIVFRPMEEVGKSMGWLKGDAKEKFAPWTEPIYEQFSLIVGGMREVEDFVHHGLLEVRPTNFARGHTFHNAFVIIDEAQNLNRNLAKFLISRIGESSQIVFAADPSDEQIDSKYLTPKNNGFVHTVASLKGEPDFAYIKLIKSVRHPRYEAIMERFRQFELKNK
jgi:PhoH-like ATPase